MAKEYQHPHPGNSDRSTIRVGIPGFAGDQTLKNQLPGPLVADNRGRAVALRRRLTIYKHGSNRGFMTGLREIVVYTRPGCHLCDVAKEVLARHGLAFSEVDIDADPELRSRYDQCVPVVVIDGKERFRGRVDELLLRRLLKGG
jgi:glutaredoxin